MKIKEITNPNNINALVAIVASYKKNTGQLNHIRDQLTKELSQAGHHRHFFVGLEDDVIIAMIQLVLNHADNNPALADGAEIAHVHNLQVRSDLQKEGRGRKMMDFVEDKARQMGKKVITLGVDDINQRAIRLYQNRGYEIFSIESGRIPEEKCLLMKKFL
jgi:ribosomal protein S18 acetylase RimI-like enzyme